MNKLFILDGVAGTGKSDLFEYVRMKRNDVNLVRKYTTRAPRDIFEKEKSDLIFIEEKEFNENERYSTFKTYKYGEKQYGYWDDELHDSIMKYENTFLIIRNKGLIKKIRSEYEMKALVITVFIFSDRGLIQQRLQADGYSQDDINFRLDRSLLVWNDYVEFDDFSDIVIINNSDITQYHQKINQLINHYKNYEKDNYFYINPIRKYRIIDPLISYKKKMTKMLENYPFEKNIFLMIKYRDENYSFRRFIEAELKTIGYNCVIANDPRWNITNDVYNPIAVLYCCKYGIALFDKPDIITDKEKPIQINNYNPNVAYELGVMHSQRKNCLILIDSTIDKIPFDLLKNLYKTYTKEEECNKYFSEWIESIKNE